MLKNTQAILLAAGNATRFNTGNTKLIEKVCGQEIALYPLAILKELQIPTTMVIGFQGKKVREVVERKHPTDVSYIEQNEANGTAQAVRLTEKSWHSDTILIMKADVPLITAENIEKLYREHTSTQATISFITAHNEDPSGVTYSRVIKEETTISVRRPQELTPQELQEHCCVSGGIYLVSRSFLEKALPTLEKNSATGEYHVSDLIGCASQQGHTVTAVRVPFDSIRGINNQQELWAVEQIKRSQLIRYWMDRGVRFSAAQTVHMDLDVEIGSGSFIGCSVHLIAGSKIGSHCTINAFSVIEGSTLDDYVTVHSHSVIRNASVGSHANIGPFAHVRDHTTIGDYSTIGNFVETSRTTIGTQTKAKHLSYLGDAQIGSNVNIGAGTITCNYDGTKKHITQIKDRVFIGTNNSLVAPVTIEQGAFTAAGSTITDNVPAESLAIARARQINKEGYARKTIEEKEASTRQDSEKIVSFMGAYKTHNDAPTTDQ